MASQNSLMVISNDDVALSNQQVARYSANKISRNDFAPGFVFGAATSAYQIEGAFADGGKGPSIWDAFSLRYPGKIEDGRNGCTAIEAYTYYKEDVKTMKKVGLDAYRFSIAWSRILPGGRLCAGINKEGIKYYSDLIDALLDEGIEPYVTLFHWDVPQCLQDEYAGFASEKIVKDFLEYVELCFWEFGDRVKYWITLNEPWTFTNHGYVQGMFPPGHGSITPQQAIGAPAIQFRSNHRPATIGLITTADPGTEPYRVAHNLILAHAEAVDLYRKHFQESQKGKIGVTNVSMWFEPFDDDSEADKDTADRCVDFMLGWFVAPIVTGDYPPIMRKLVGERLPTFSSKQEALVKGSYDFLGINYYTTRYAKYTPNPEGTPPSYYADQLATFLTERDGIPIGPKGGSDWMYIVPRGIRSLLLHIKETYSNPIIYITENGVDEVNDMTKTVSEGRSDETRIKYYQDHLEKIRQAMTEGVDVKGYFLWSLFDNYEWAQGYTVRFGIFYVDYENGRFTRYPKTSAFWWKNFLVRKMLKSSRKRQLLEEVDDVEAVKRLRNGQAYA